MPDQPSPRTTRRRVLATSLAVGSVAVGGAGCDLSAGSDEESPTPPTTGPGTVAATDPSPDQELLVDVADAIAATAAVVAGARRGRPELRRSLREAARLHRVHLAELSADTTPAERVRVPGDDGRALQEVRSAERRLQRRLADASVAAQSGPLAALLASMSAAVAQQLATGELR